MLALIDNRIDSASLLALSKTEAELILMPPAKFLQNGVASHPDMIIFIGFGKLFCHESYYAENRELIDKVASGSTLELTLSNEPTGKKYPLDVLFNAALVGNRLICNTKTVSKLVLEAARAFGCEIVHVPQGYTKCSTCIVSDNAIITADRPIFDACRDAGIDALLISEGHIDLTGYGYGFIGGASGVCGDKVYFCGDTSLHPDGERIKEFCQKHGKTAVSLSDKRLYDVGTIMFI